jgi:hypothetical protein
MRGAAGAVAVTGRQKRYANFIRPSSALAAGFHFFRKCSNVAMWSDREAAPTKNAMRNNPQKKTAQGEHAARWGVEMLEFAEMLACADAGRNSGQVRITGSKARPPTTARSCARRRLSR